MNTMFATQRRFYWLLIAGLLLIPRYASAFSSAGSGERNTDQFPIVYWVWDIRMDNSYDDNPCYKVSNCYIIYGEMVSETSFSVYKRVNAVSNGPTLADIWGGLSSPLFRFDGKKYDATNGYPEPYPCAKFGYQIGSSLPISLEGWCTSSGPPTPPPLSCSVNTSSILLQHSTLSTTDLPGNKKEVSFNVSCSRSASVKLAMTGLNNNSQLALAKNGSIYSTLKINDTPANTGIRLNKVDSGGVQVKVSSTLGLNGTVEGGDYSGSAILVLSIL
ncbi:hypothetical protein EKN38_22435 [Enterobacter sp. WCHEn045836]|uniref:MrpH family fimbial adhesin n=1 Tax=Enterobacter sp. WCHEn045836 TaxID=2497434 RepID=UPI000F818441|nr:hypothetical protein [Enterobacter sp. WCHEn045836]RTP97295.1 hypothetical protein EKN38_22435 [Enterobacter sp. WCHEn045836]